jgi:DNA-binding NarL/FixJ family response regulator
VLQHGAAGIFLKHNPARSLLRAIRVVASGDAWLDQKVIQFLAARSPRAGNPSFLNAFADSGACE